MEVRRKAISIVLSMTSSRNAEDVVLFLKTQEADFEKVCSCSAGRSILMLIYMSRYRNTGSFSFDLSMSQLSSSRRSLRASCMP